MFIMVSLKNGCMYLVETAAVSAPVIKSGTENRTKLTVASVDT